ncbi:MAG: O-phospho-L-seryl-tRNA:Cys-tRNA synthase [Candidatus Bathyarchaeia archaeon]
MDIRAKKIYQAEFLLEDIRELLRKTSPKHEFSAAQRKEFDDKLKVLRKVLDELERNEGADPPKYITDKIEVRTKEEEFINIHPIQPGGRLTPEARKALIAYGDGYATCDWCFKPFRLDMVKRPPIYEFCQELAEFVGMDVARVVRGARRGFQIIMGSLLERGDIVLISSLGHYSMALAIESVGGIWKEVPLNENNIVTAENTADKIEEVKGETGKYPKLIAISHYDYMLGNEHDIHGIAKVAKEYDIPFLDNEAYGIGVRPVNGKEIGADFVVGSGHKSFAAPAPTGILATTEEYKDKVFATTVLSGDVTGRKFGIKETYLLGCTVMGAPLIAMMASFPRVKERVKQWDEEVEKSNYFINEFLKIEGNNVLSEMPRKHTLSKVDSTESFNRIASRHKRRGYFLYDELYKRRILGIFPGATKQYKLNVYGLTWDQIRYLADAFKEIAEKHGLHVSD